jgi:hypothetical protein
MYSSSLTWALKLTIRLAKLASLALIDSPSAWLTRYADNTLQPPCRCFLSLPSKYSQISLQVHWI